ncbi:hypothetical protein AVEN_33491-1 [Araneus ventricosus]|uniref:Uncharacterized protein n=1 Tax=Araneus ventricosus TaxID=182803 RepID=A0A4Y2GTD9_ARAVE|nr:hypothetical protein AVEN_33491-1 [Araneus ventricosus]
MLSDGVILLHANTHTARKTQELQQKFKWEVRSHPPCSPELAHNLSTKHFSILLIPRRADSSVRVQVDSPGVEHSCRHGESVAKSYMKY